jgi:hypothetical protein
MDQLQKAAPQVVPAQTPDGSRRPVPGHNTNKSSAIVHSPAPSKVNEIPRGATAKCNDNTFTFIPRGKGTCLGHGGVLRWLDR